MSSTFRLGVLAFGLYLGGCAPHNREISDVKAAPQGNFKDPATIHKELTVKINKDNFKCTIVEEPAHAGKIEFPFAVFTTDGVKGTDFKHEQFSGQVSTDCGLVERIIKSAEPSGKIKIKMHYMKGQNVFQDVKDGPIKAIESWELVILDFPNEVYLTSQKSEKKKF